jgi:hypothetical protein
LAKGQLDYFVKLGEIACCWRLKPVYNAVRSEFRTELPVHSLFEERVIA